MRIVVTGGSGRLGRYVTKELSRDHEVTVFDRIEPTDPAVRFRKGDITNILDCRRACEGMDAAVHLAAIPDPLRDPAEAVFRVNTMGTFNIHQAACEAGMRKVVHASSNSVYGFHFRKEGEEPIPEYLPIDEDHPQRPADPYGLSKKLGEEIAMSFTRQYGIATVAIRICWVWFPENLKDYVTSANDPKGFMGLWSLIDCRDAAVAFRLAVEADDLRSFESFVITATDNGTPYQSRDLVRKYFSERIEYRRDIRGRNSLFDGAKAKAVLGFSPRYTAAEILKGEMAL